MLPHEGRLLALPKPSIAMRRTAVSQSQRTGSAVHRSWSGSTRLKCDRSAPLLRPRTHLVPERNDSGLSPSAGTLSG